MTEKTEKVYGVLLTENGWQELEEVLKAYTRSGPMGRYLYPAEVDMSLPNYCWMRIQTVDGSKFEAEIYVPHHYVKYVVAAADDKEIGFALSGQENPI